MYYIHFLNLVILALRNDSQSQFLHDTFEENFFWKEYSIRQNKTIFIMYAHLYITFV
jgi:hypothetical protein